MLTDPKRLFAFSLCFVSIACTSYGQSSKPVIAFPTYRQIKARQETARGTVLYMPYLGDMAYKAQFREQSPRQREVFDQVPAPNSRITTTAVSLSASAGSGLNVFDYPAGTVTYYLNDQPTTDVQYVKEVLNNKSISVETISIGQPD